MNQISDASRGKWKVDESERERWRRERRIILHPGQKWGKALRCMLIHGMVYIYIIYIYIYMYIHVYKKTAYLFRLSNKGEKRERERERKRVKINIERRKPSIRWPVRGFFIAFRDKAHAKDQKKTFKAVLRWRNYVTFFNQFLNFLEILVLGYYCIKWFRDRCHNTLWMNLNVKINKKM